MYIKAKNRKRRVAEGQIGMSWAPRPIQVVAAPLRIILRRRPEPSMIDAIHAAPPLLFDRRGVSVGTKVQERGAILNFSTFFQVAGEDVPVRSSGVPEEGQEASGLESDEPFQLPAVWRPRLDVG